MKKTDAIGLCYNGSVVANLYDEYDENHDFLIIKFCPFCGKEIVLEEVK